MSDNLLTIFTPTYNRIDLLERCYHSLQRQTDKDFIWIIIDDGSEDNTKETVKRWIETNNQFVIKYFYKENEGLHTAYNLAIEKMETELCVCIDSDDFASDNCVEIIKSCWNNRNKNKDYAGIFGLNYTPQNELIGGKFLDIKEINIVDWTMGKYPVKFGDKKIVVRVDLYKSVFPMKKYKGEKNYNPNYMNIKVGFDRSYIALDECLCFVDYQPQGMTNSMLWQYYNSPNSFADIRLLYLSFPNAPLKFKIKHSIHYCSSCFLAHRKKFIRESPHSVLAVFCTPFGFLLSRYIKYKNKYRK